MSIKESLPSSDPQVVEIEELKITARRDRDGGYGFDVYDAAELFSKATQLLQQNRCQEAVPIYDKLVKEFPSSQYLSASLYNSGLCLQSIAKLEEAVQRYADLIERLPRSDDSKDAAFQLIQVLHQLGDWDKAIEREEQLLRREDLSSEERMEAMSYHAQAYLGSGLLELAESQARNALIYYRTRPDDQVIRDELFAAQANFVIAECFRKRAEAVDLPPSSVEEQRKVLNHKAELILDAQRQYFNTSQFKAPRLAAASWYSIGHMYDGLWDAIMQAPVPNHLSPEAHDIYRSELAKLIEPLIRHAIRYWEATLMFIERTADHSDWTVESRMEWVKRTRNDLERARKRLLSQLPGSTESLNETPTE